MSPISEDRKDEVVESKKEDTLPQKRKYPGNGSGCMDHSSFGVGSFTPPHSC
ncbi:hypothetical protein J6590_047171 [Homalodisca vitripennis]|nr:hypothetical protein J6590_047171 [Homalodisca vitripennis]